MGVGDREEEGHRSKEDAWGDVSGEQKHTGLPCGLFLVVDAENTHGEQIRQKKKCLWEGRSSEHSG